MICHEIVYKEFSELVLSIVFEEIPDCPPRAVPLGDGNDLIATSRGLISGSCGGTAACQRQCAPKVGVPKTVDHDLPP